MGGHDLSRWVTAVSWRQGRRELHREWSVTLTGWVHIDRAARWDIFAGYGDGGEVVARQGIIPPDWQPVLRAGPQSAPPTLQVRGVDWVWLAVRLRRPDTIVIAPNRREGRRAVRRYESGGRAKPTGRVMFVGAATMHDAVVALGELAGFHVVPLIPNYKVQGHVCDPTYSLWDAIWELVRPFAPFAHFRRERNEVVIADRVHAMEAAVGIGLSPSIIQDVTIEPVRDANLRRIIVRIPPWEDVQVAQ